MLEISFSQRFEQEVQNLPFAQDLDKLKSDLKAHLEGIHNDEMPVSYLGNTGAFNDPPDVADAGMGKIHVWDTSTSWFTTQKQRAWNHASHVGARRSDTFLVYCQHFFDEHRYQFLGVLVPGHEKIRHGGNGYGYLRPFVPDANNFQET